MYSVTQDTFSVKDSCTSQQYPSAIPIPLRPQNYAHPMYASLPREDTADRLWNDEFRPTRGISPTSDDVLPTATNAPDANSCNSDALGRGLKVPWPAPASRPDPKLSPRGQSPARLGATAATEVLPQVVGEKEVPFGHYFNQKPSNKSSRRSTDSDAKAAQNLGRSPESKKPAKAKNSAVDTDKRRAQHRGQLQPQAS